MRTIIILLCLFSSIHVIKAQSRIVEQFKEKTTSQSFYAYQSMLRLLNTDDNKEFNYLIRDLDFIRIVMTKAGTDATEEFNALNMEIKDDGYESMLIMNNKNIKWHLYEKVEKSKSYWIASLFAHDRAGVLEMKGSLDLQYIKALQSINESILEDMMTQQGFDWD